GQRGRLVAIILSLGRARMRGAGRRLRTSPGAGGVVCVVLDLWPRWPGAPGDAEPRSRSAPNRRRARVAALPGARCDRAAALWSRGDDAHRHHRIADAWTAAL